MSITNNGGSSINKKGSNIMGRLDGVDKTLLAGSSIFGWVAISAWHDSKLVSSALDKIRQAKAVPISGLRSLLYDSQSSSDDNLVVVRGVVKAIKSCRGTNFVVEAFHLSGESFQGVVLQEEGWFRNTIKATVPFALRKKGASAFDDSLFVNLQFSNHPLPPLTKVYDHYQFLDHVQGKMLKVGREVSAVGRIFSSNGDGTQPQIRACEDLPYFLSDMTKEEMVEYLANKTGVLFWGAVVCGSLSLGLIGYVYWRHHKVQILKTYEQLRNNLHV